MVISFECCLSSLAAALFSSKDIALLSFTVGSKTGFGTLANTRELFVTVALAAKDSILDTCRDSGYASHKGLSNKPRDGCFHIFRKP